MNVIKMVRFVWKRSGNLCTLMYRGREIGKEKIKDKFKNCGGIR